jgi:hypothetical protein
MADASATAITAPSGMRVARRVPTVSVIVRVAVRSSAGASGSKRSASNKILNSSVSSSIGKINALFPKLEYT